MKTMAGMSREKREQTAAVLEEAADLVERGWIRNYFAVKRLVPTVDLPAAQKVMGEYVLSQVAGIVDWNHPGATHFCAGGAHQRGRGLPALLSGRLGRLLRTLPGHPSGGVMLRHTKACASATAAAEAAVAAYDAAWPLACPICLGEGFHGGEPIRPDDPGPEPCECVEENRCPRCSATVLTEDPCGCPVCGWGPGLGLGRPELPYCDCWEDPANIVEA